MSTTNFIPKEKRAAYQRWKFDSLDTPEPVKQSDTPTDSELNKQQDEQDKSTLSTEEQIASIYQQAQEEGYAAGYQAGKKDAEVEIQAEVARLQTLLSDLDQDLQQIDQVVAQDLLTLALDLTKKMITQALRIRPEIILPIVQEAIRQLPSSTQHPLLVLHPDDAVLVRDHIGDQLSQSRWEVREDEQVEKGGCRLEANGSEIDASLSTRWQKVLATIAQTDNWLEQ